MRAVLYDILYENKLKNSGYMLNSEFFSLSQAFFPPHLCEFQLIYFFTSPIFDLFKTALPYKHSGVLLACMCTLGKVVHFLHIEVRSCGTDGRMR